MRAHKPHIIQVNKNVYQQCDDNDGSFRRAPRNLFLFPSLFLSFSQCSQCPVDRHMCANRNCVAPGASPIQIYRLLYCVLYIYFSAVSSFFALPSNSKKCELHLVFSAQIFVCRFLRFFIHSLESHH